MAEPVVSLVAATGRTPLGRCMLSSAAAVRAGLSSLVKDRWLSDERGRGVVTSRAAWLPPELSVLDRMMRLARPAAFQAFAALRSLPRPRVDVFLGLPDPSRAGRPANLEGVMERVVREAAGRTAEVGSIEIVARDHASCLVALERARRLIVTTAADLCVVGGVDSYLEQETIEELEAAHRLKTPRQRYGFVPGEAAAFVVLASPAIALPSITQVLGAAVREERAIGVRAGASRDSEAAHDRPPATVVTGEALGECYRFALAGLPATEQLGRMIGDLNGEPHRADDAGMALTRAAKSIGKPPAVLSPAASWGDVGAASGALFLGVVAAAAERGWAAKNTLVWAASESGERGAALLVS